MNWSSNKGKLWNGKQIGSLLLTVTVADPKQFTPKCKPVIYIGAFVELYNWKNGGQIDEIHRIIELEKMHALIAENLRNLGTH